MDVCKIEDESFADVQFARQPCLKVKFLRGRARSIAKPGQNPERFERRASEVGPIKAHSEAPSEPYFS